MWTCPRHRIACGTLFKAPAPRASNAAYNAFTTSHNGFQNHGGALSMRTFDYHRPATLTELSAALKATPDARLLAGGMTLIPALKLRLATPPAVVDLSAIGDLRGIRVAAGSVTVGAMTRH